MAILTLLSSSTQGTSATYFFDNTKFTARTFQATVSGTGAVTGKVTITVSNDNVGYIPFTVFNMSGTTTVCSGMSDSGPWPYINVSLDTLTGTGASATVTMGI